MSLASLELPIGIFLLMFGLGYGVYNWRLSALTDTVTPAGTVMLSALPILTGIQLILAFFGNDIGSVPRIPRHRGLRTGDLSTGRSTK